MPVLDWIGREAVVGHARRVPLHLLTPDDAVSTDPASENWIVEGDNLVALRALLPQFAGQVKCVYIDPPYNTGNEGWAYNDNMKAPEMQAWLRETLRGGTVGKEGEDLSRHDKWLCMMYPRLVLLREFLREDGSIWISLDDNEVHHARVILDEIFGAQNFVAMIAWEKRYTRSNNAKMFYSVKDSILVYRKSDALSYLREARTEKSDANYANPDGDPRGPWATSSYVNPATREQRSNLVYDIEAPDGRIVEHPTHAWKYSPSEHQRHKKENLLWWGQDGSAQYPRLKLFLSEGKGLVPVDLWRFEDSGTTDEGGNELKEMFGSAVFDTPKPVRLIQRILQIATGPDDLVLDAFAGSGTTGHAVLAQNALDGGRRRFVLVEMEAAVAAPVTAERVRRAASGYAFTGTARTELLRERLTPRVLRRMDEVIERADALKARHAGEGVTFGEAVDKGAYVLTKQEAVAERRAGLGGGFRFARLGAPLVDDDGVLSAEASAEAVAALAFFAATGRSVASAGQAGGAAGAAVRLPLAGVAPGGGGPGGGGHAVFVLGLDGGADVLTSDGLDGLAALLPPGFAGRWTVFASACRVPASDLEARGVAFRQTPYALVSG